MEKIIEDVSMIKMMSILIIALGLLLMDLCIVWLHMR